MPSADCTVLAVGVGDPSPFGDEQTEFDVRFVPTATRGLEYLDAPYTTIDCIVAEQNLPESDGVAFLERVRESYTGVPFVLCIDDETREVAEDAITYDATDYHLYRGSNQRSALLAHRIQRLVRSHRAQWELERRTDRLETLIETLPGIVYRCRNESRWPIEFMEGECEEITGYPRAAFERGEISLGHDVIHPDDRESAWNAVQNALEADDRYEVTYRIRTADGRTKWIWERGQGLYRDGDLEFLEGFITDITDRKEQRDKRRRNQRRFEAVFEDPSMLVALLDLDGTLLQVNETAVDYIDTDRADVLGTPFWNAPWWAEDDRERVREWIDRASNGDYVEYEADHESADGTLFSVSGTIRPVTDESGTPTSLIVSAHDITDRRRYNQQLEETRDKLMVLNQVVRHDLRNHMQVVRGRGRLLSDHVSDRGAEHLEEVLLSAEEAIDLTETARELTETMLGSGNELYPVSLGDVLKSSIETARSQYPNATIDLERPADDITVRADEMVESVVHNLLQNAVVHNHTERPTVAVSIEPREETVLLCVADDGPGIPDARKETVFGRGNMGLESPGTGIGLYLVSTLLEQYGGDVQIADNEPTGTVFEIRLPRADTDDCD